MIVELYLKENWVLKIWCFWILVCRRLLRDPWTARRSNQSILKEFSPEYSLKGLMLKLQSFGHLLQRTDSLEKNSNAGKDWRQEENGMTEDEMVGWHHLLDGHEFEQVPEVADGQRSLVYHIPWGHKESDMTEQLIWLNENSIASNFFNHNWLIFLLIVFTIVKGWNFYVLEAAGNRH